jgi:hypothetical protein
MGTGEHPESQEAGKSSDESLWWLGARHEIEQSRKKKPAKLRSLRTWRIGVQGAPTNESLLDDLSPVFTLRSAVPVLPKRARQIPGSLAEMRNDGTEAGKPPGSVESLEWANKLKVTSSMN